MIEEKIQPALSSVSFSIMKAMRSAYDRFKLPVISTGRSFAYYRRIFFENRSEGAVLADLRGKRIVDVGCGLTPYVSDSMFQICRKAGVEFYGVDPKLAKGFTLGLFDRLKIGAVGGGRMIPDAPGLERAVGSLADNLPFDTGSVDLVLTCYVLYAWIQEEDILAKIFGEFHRVLKPGGKVMVFPTPYYDPKEIAHPEFRRVMEGFRISQEFRVNPFRVMETPPAYVRIMEKR